jgi:high-affinity nickel permease
MEFDPILIILVIVVKGLLVWWATYLAGNRDASKIGWGILTFFFGIWAILALCLFVRKRTNLLEESPT